MAEVQMMARRETDVRVEERQDSSWWEDEEGLKQFCAQQLCAGRLALILGAGVSVRYGLPSWSKLLRKAFRLKGLPVPKGNMHPLKLAKHLLTKAFHRDEIAFAEAIRDALYPKAPISTRSLMSKELLNALGAITMPSVRGGVREVVTFNFDDVLERYLAYFGIVTQSVSTLSTWRSRADVIVYHPHGFLPSDRCIPLRAGILLARLQFEKSSTANGKGECLKEVWYRKLLDIFQSSTCVFIGLSGDDPEFTKLLCQAYETHVDRSHGSKASYWGIRFSDKKDDAMREAWNTRGVYQQTIKSYNLLPGWLFDLCRRASEMTARVFRSANLADSRQSPGRIIQ